MQSSTEKLLQELFPPMTANDAKRRPETAGSQFRVSPSLILSPHLILSPTHIQLYRQL
jgi:hypothetical protein